MAHTACACGGSSGGAPAVYVTTRACPFHCACTQPAPSDCPAISSTVMVYGHWNAVVEGGKVHEPRDILGAERRKLRGGQWPGQTAVLDGATFLKFPHQQRRAHARVGSLSPAPSARPPHPPAVPHLVMAAAGAATGLRHEGGGHASRGRCRSSTHRRVTRHRRPEGTAGATAGVPWLSVLDLKGRNRFTARWEPCLQKTLFLTA
jgi:hypothetical protein